MPSTIGASVDVGSTSVHLLVAVVDGHVIHPLVDESSFLGLGDAVATHPVLGPRARAGLTETLVRYVGVARKLGAARITLIATEPLRRAIDAPAAIHDVGVATGHALHVLTHEEEAYLTVVGVLAGRPVERETLIVDLGGGSSEFCVVHPRGPTDAVGVRIGAGRLTKRFAAHDPPIATELDAMRAEARSLLVASPPATPGEIVAVGGTVSNLLKVVAGDGTDAILTRDRIATALERLTEGSAEASAARFTLKPLRARILPAGAVIAEALLERYDLDALRVSEVGLREGAILAAAHLGRGWRDGLPGLVQGWHTP